MTLPEQQANDLRREYEQQVTRLADLASALLRSGLPDEAVARRVHAARRALTREYKSRTPEPLRGRIRARTVAVYGDEIGPTIDFLRQCGASWADIIRGASRPGAGVS